MMRGCEQESDFGVLVSNTLSAETFVSTCSFLQLLSFLLYRLVLSNRLELHRKLGKVKLC
jgi:hypothetical protein